MIKMSELIVVIITNAFLKIKIVLSAEEQKSIKKIMKN